MDGWRTLSYLYHDIAIAILQVKTSHIFKLGCIKQQSFHGFTRWKSLEHVTAVKLLQIEHQYPRPPPSLPLVLTFCGCLLAVSTIWWMIVWQKCSKILFLTGYWSCGCGWLQHLLQVVDDLIWLAHECDGWDKYVTSWNLGREKTSVLADHQANDGGWTSDIRMSYGTRTSICGGHAGCASGATCNRVARYMKLPLRR